jgi:YesN/AraC family two-component response regulator
MHKILVVDDEKKSRDFISDLITFFIPDGEITQVSNPFAALKLIKQQSFDLLFSDIEMPQMSGLEMTGKIRNENKTIFIVLISAYDKFEYAQKAIEIGASGYILKPFSKEYVGKIIQTYRDIKSQAKNKEIVLINKSDCSIPVKIEDIVAIEKKEGHFLSIYTKTSCLHNIRGTLHKIAGQLPSNFSYINRQCIINHLEISYISSINEVHLSNKERKLIFICSRENKKRLLVVFNSMKNEK